MAKLPTERDLSGISNPNSERRVASYDITGYARGDAARAAGNAAAATALGQEGAAEAAGFSELGKGMTSAGRDVSLVAQQQAADDEKLELARAKADFQVKKIGLDTDIANDQDHATLPKRYSESLDKIREGSSSLITSPKTQEKFNLSVADDVARGNAAATLQAQKLWRDATVTDANTQLEDIRDAALKSQDPVERERIITTGNDLIQSLVDKQIITPETATKTRKEWTERYAEKAISILPAEDRVKALAGFEGTLANRESSGRPGLVNQLGYAGLFQFGAPRLAALGLYTPGEGENLKTWSQTPRNAEGKWSGTFTIPGHPEVRTLNDFLASPAAQKEAFGTHTATMDQEIDRNGFDKYIGQSVGGVEITREGLRAMIHLGGVGGARDALTGKGNATDANGTSVMDYAKLGLRSSASQIASILPEDRRVSMLQSSQREVDQGKVKIAQDRSETWERSIIDAGAGIGTLPKRSDIETDGALDEPRRNTLLRQYDNAAGDVAAFQRVLLKFKDPNAGAFNPYDKDERKAVDTLFTHLGGDTAALQAVADRTSVMPASAAAKIRGDIVSNDPKRVEAALSMSSNLMARNQNIFTVSEGKSDIENNTVTYRHFVDDLGMTGADAAKRIIQEQSPEYQASVKARLKTEDIDAKIKKELSISDLEGSFDPSWGWMRNPNVGFDPAQRIAMYGQYAEQVKERYLETGDWGAAKKQAANDLKKTWGVSNVSGSVGVTGGGVVMQYPPERAPAYQGVENVSDAIARQAIDAVKTEAGADIDRKNIRLQPIPGVTATAYKAGQPPPYMLMWSDKDGTVHMLNPGKAFVADPQAMRATQTETRRAGLEQAVGEVDAAQQARDAAARVVGRRQTPAPINEVAPAETVPGEAQPAEPSLRDRLLRRGKRQPTAPIGSE